MMLKIDFFGICIPLGYYICTLPDIFEPKSPLARKLYKCYTIPIYFIALMLQVTEFFKLSQLLATDQIIIDEIIKNCVFTSIHFTAMVKSKFLRGNRSEALFKKVIAFEKHIYDNKNAALISKYRFTLAPVQKMTTYYFLGLTIVVVLYITSLALRDPYYIQNGNETVVVPQLPLSSWTPVDNNYWLAFIWSSAAGSFLGVFFVTTDLTIFSFILFGVSQLEILQYNIANFYLNAAMLRQDHITINDSYRILQKNYIAQHQDIIRYVILLNESLKYIMLLDFIPSSVQLAGLIFQLMANFSILQCVLLGGFIFLLIARIFIYCNSANNLAIHSQKVGDAWYEIDWIELPRDVQRNIVLSIMRSQKPLRITIGDFQEISLETFLAILKGTYSYMMLLLSAI